MRSWALVALVGWVIAAAGHSAIAAPPSTTTRSGASVIVAADGARFKGSTKNGLFHGKGRLVWPNGDAYAGDFVKGRFHGHGKFTNKRGDVYAGQFNRGDFEGRGVVTYGGGGSHEGLFKQWEPSGQGTMTNAHGVTFEGNFDGNSLVGPARIVTKDGSRYHGETQHEAPHGQGEVHMSNGSHYKGGFQHGQFAGQGTLTHAQPVDGVTVESGEWQYGRLKSKQDERMRQARASAEAALYSQPARLAKAQGALKPSDPDRINMYLLAVAGDGSQEVFRREAEFVQNQFDAQYGTLGRSLVLINSRSNSGQAPLATVTSIAQSIQAIAAKMNVEKDILFLYVTSHGSEKHELALGVDGIDLPPLPAKELAAMLQASGIRWKVVVVSACYAGGFVDPIKNDQTLVMTAARHDRQSFGCADENDFTFFGRALFKESLPQSQSFPDAFARATQLINIWEEDKALQQPSANAGLVNRGGQRGGTGKPDDKYSLPQMAEADAINAHLARWWKQRDARTAQ